MLTSTIKNLADFRTILGSMPAEYLDIKIDELITNRLSALTKKYATVSEVEVVAARDLVVAELESDKEKYNKKQITIAVGSGLFSQAFETLLVGLKRGETKRLVVNGLTVKTTVLDIKRQTVPELTEAIVIKEGIEGVTTVGEFKKHLYDEQLAEQVQKQSKQITCLMFNEIVAKSEFIIRETDVDMLIQRHWEETREMCAHDVKTLLVAREVAKEDNVVINEETYAENLAKASETVDYIAYYFHQHMLFLWDKILHYVMEANQGKWRVN